MPSGLSPKKLAVLKRRKLVAEMYLAGKAQWEIGEFTGVTQQMISLDLAVIRNDWQAAHVAAFDTRVAQELAKIDNLEVMARAAWQESCKGAETLHTERETGRLDKQHKPLPDREKRSRTVRGQAGDPRFLDQIRWCIEQRLTLVGAYLKKDAPPAAAPSVNLSVTIDRYRQLPVEEKIRQLREEIGFSERN